MKRKLEIGKRPWFTENARGSFRLQTKANTRFGRSIKNPEKIKGLALDKKKESAILSFID